MFICTVCHTRFPKWSGRCLQCNEWNSLEEEVALEKNSPQSRMMHTGRVCEVTKIETGDHIQKGRYLSSSGELDTVLGGGMTAGSLILLSGEPGIGKSTLALQMAHWYTQKRNEVPVRVLYVSGEESSAQISRRAFRLGIQDTHIDILAQSNFDNIVATIEQSEAKIIILDSLSVLSSQTLDGVAGSVTQIRAMTEVAMHIAKKTQKSILLIGHITKDGSISGPKALEHLVDVVLFLEGVRTENYRLLRALKNRFGPTDAVGLFRMEEKGLIDLPNPGMEFIDSENFSFTGSALTITLEGIRPILIEIEALTTTTKFGYPKRSGRGVPLGKLDIQIAIMTKYTSVKLENVDVYINIARGLSISEPGVDLAMIAAIVSSRKNIPLGKTLFFGEVSLTGGVKNVFLLEKRIAEAAKLGFHTMFIPKGYTGKIPAGVEVIRVATAKECIEKIL